MVDFNSEIKNQHGMPKLDGDYWNAQKQYNKQENINLFDDLIKTNFDVENMKGISVFSPHKK